MEDKVSQLTDLIDELGSKQVIETLWSHTDYLYNEGVPVDQLELMRDEAQELVDGIQQMIDESNRLSKALKGGK